MDGKNRVINVYQQIVDKRVKPASALLSFCVFLFQTLYNFRGLFFVLYAIHTAVCVAID